MTTTIKVSTATRDRLKRQAAARGVTMGQHLERLADFGDRAERLDVLRRAVADTPPDVRREYDREAAEWQSLDRSDWPRD